VETTESVELLKRVLDRLEQVGTLTARPEQVYFTVREAAEFVRCEHKLIRRHIWDGTLPASNIGSNDGPDYRISRADLGQWMEKRKAGAFLPPPRKKKSAEPAPLPFSQHRRPSKTRGNAA
jgi:excisionase family DNA binding protein